MAFAAIAAGIGVAGAAAKIGEGIHQNSEASAINKNNPRPIYQIPQQFQDNYNLAKQMAQIGMPVQQYNNAINGINQNQAGAIGALSNSANPGANLAAIVRGGDAATNNLNAQDAQVRQGNQRYAIQQNGILGQQELAKQQSDKFDKYTENFNKAAALQGAGGQNIAGGASDLAGLAGAYLTGKSNGGFGAPGQQQGAANWGYGTMGAKYNAPLLTNTNPYAS